MKAEDIVRGSYTKQEGFEPNYVITPYGLTASRVRILGTVVDTYVNEDESYGALTLDDGTETIRAKFFQDLDMMQGFEEGDIVEVVGKVKKYDGETYVNPEMVVERDANHEMLREVEVKEMRENWEEYVETAEEMDADEESIVQELQGKGLKEREARGVLEFLEEDFEEEDRSPAPVDTGGEESGGEEEGDSHREDVLNAIETVDEGEGAEYGDIQEEAGVGEEVLEDVINDLLSDGTCYEPRPGRIKKL